MHHWRVGGTVSVGWPQFQRPEWIYEIVELELLGRVFWARVTDGEKQGGFLVILDCPAPVLEELAELATQTVGFKVILSSLLCSIDGQPLRSFDYEWYPTPEYADRPSLLARTLADLLEGMQGGGNC